jgi:hypothetical protein
MLRCLRKRFAWGLRRFLRHRGGARITGARTQQSCPGDLVLQNSTYPSAPPSHPQPSEHWGAGRSASTPAHLAAVVAGDEHTLLPGKLERSHGAHHAPAARRDGVGGLGAGRDGEERGRVGMQIPQANRAVLWGAKGAGAGWRVAPGSGVGGHGCEGK